MTDQSIRLGPEDPTIFAVCPRCGRKGRGAKQGSYFGKAYTLRRFKRPPKCENCRTTMVKLFEIPVDRRPEKRVRRAAVR